MFFCFVHRFRYIATKFSTVEYISFLFFSIYQGKRPAEIIRQEIDDLERLLLGLYEVVVFEAKSRCDKNENYKTLAFIFFGHGETIFYEF